MDGVLLPLSSRDGRAASDTADLEPAEGRLRNNESDDPERLNFTAKITYHQLTPELQR